MQRVYLDGGTSAASGAEEITIRKRPPELPVELIARDDQLDSAATKRSLAYLVALTAAISAGAIGLSIYRLLEVAAKALGHIL